jgi:predicted nucleotidyltransferase
LKGVFYALRPAAVLHWMSLHANGSVPPMRLQTLLVEAPPPAEVVASISELLGLKAQTREMGAGAVPEPIRRFVVDQLYAPRWDGTGERRRPEAEARAEAADLFRALLDPFPG